MQLSDEELDRLEQLEAAATAGPWIAMIEGRDHESGSDFIMTGGAGALRGPDIEMSGASKADQDFVAAARNALPTLISELKKARGRRSV